MKLKILFLTIIFCLFFLSVTTAFAGTKTIGEECSAGNHSDCTSNLCLEAVGDTHQCTACQSDEECTTNLGDDKIKCTNGVCALPVATTPAVKKESGTSKVIDSVFSPTDQSNETIDEINAILSAPQVKITIPGLNFTDPKTVGQYTKEEGGNSYMYMPYIGEYIAVVYRYIIVVSGLLAVILIAFSGYQIVISGGNQEKVTDAKKRIANAITGLVIALFSYVLLFTINPDLVEFNSLKILYIKGLEFDTDASTFPLTPSDISFTGNAIVGQSKNNYNIYDFKQYHIEEGSKDYWGNIPYGCDGTTGSDGDYTIWHSGCYFVSTVNILNSFYPNAGDPGQIIKFFHENSALGKGCKTYNLEDALKQNWIQTKFPGLETTRDTKLTPQELTSAIDNNELIVLCVGPSSIATGGHCITVYGYYQKNGKTYLNTSDPGTNKVRCAMDDEGTRLEEDLAIKKKIKDGKCPGETTTDKCKNCGGQVVFETNDYPMNYVLNAQKYALIFSKPNSDTPGTTAVTGPAATNNKCTFTELRWNTITGTSEVFRQETEAPYDKVIKSDPNYVSKIDKRCSICEEDQTTINVNGQNTKVCWAYADQVKQILNSAVSSGFKINSLIGYRPLRAAGTIDSKGFRTGVGGHIYGMAIDINSNQNGLYNNCKSWDIKSNPILNIPPDPCTLNAGGRWNAVDNPNETIYYGSPIYNLFKKQGWLWAGTDLGDGSQRDLMDFSIYGYDFSTS